MALTKNQLKTLVIQKYPDQDLGLIGPPDEREVLNAIIDALFEIEESLPNTDFIYKSNIFYKANDLIVYQDNWYRSKTDENRGNLPPLSGENDHWKIVGAVSTGIDYWGPNVYFQDPSIVLYDNKLYYLNRSLVGETPFQSLDFEEELSNDEWILLGGVSTPVSDNLTGTSATTALSENQGRILKGFIDAINTLLQSDDSTLDELQEIVEFIKINREDLENLGIPNIAGLQSALDALVKSSDLPGLITSNPAVQANTAKRSYPQSEQDKVAANTLKRTYPVEDQNKLGTIQEGAQVNKTVDETIQEIESKTGESRLDVTKLKNLEIPNVGQFERVDNIFQIKTDPAPTQDSQAFVDSGSLFSFLNSFSNDIGSVVNFTSFTPTGIPTIGKLVNADGVILGFNSSSDPRYIRSEDGVNFRIITAPSGAAIHNAIYVGGVVLVVASNSGTSSIWRSVDKGLTWTVITTPDSNWRTIEYGNGRIVICSYKPSIPQVAYSDDMGLTWTLGSVQEVDDATSIIYGGGIWLLIATEWSVIERSTDGITFTKVPNNTAGFFNKGIYFKNKFFLTAFGGSGTSPRGRVSDDMGLTWSSFPIIDNAITITALDKVGKYLFAAGNGGQIMRSENGVDWEEIESPTTGQIVSFVFVGGDKGDLILGSSGSVQLLVRSGNIY